MFTTFDTPDGPVRAHLSLAKTPHVVPGPERHRWLLKKLLGGQSTTCEKCGCKKTLRRDYTTVFQLPGGPVLTERPACTGDSSSTA